MKNKRKLMVQIAVVLLLVAVGACMMWIGRGHTIYFDNKTLKTDGAEYPAFQRLEVSVNGERVARLAKKERGSATCMGQKFTFSMEVTEKKGDDPVHYDVTLDLPYGIDGVVINIPAYLAGQPKEVWQSEFVPMVVKEEPEEIETDEFGIGGDI